MAIEVAGVVARLGFNVDDDGANRFERKIRDLRSDSKRPVVAPLKGEIQGKDLDLYDRKLTELRDKVRRRDAFKAKLGADFDSRAFSAYERESRKAEKATDANVRSQGRLRTAFGSVSSAGVGMFAAAGGGYAVYSGLKSIITASGDAEASMAKVRTMVQNAGIDFDKHAKQIDKTIQAHSRLTGFDDEDLAESFANMIRTTGNLNEAFRLNAIAADVARAKGTDLAGAQSLVARVANGSFNGLKRLGLSIDPVTKAQDALTNSSKKYTVEQMRAAKEQDKTATSQKAIALLQRTFAGQAAKYGQTQSGAIDRLKVAWENLQETLGKKLAPTVTKAANAIARFLTQMTDGTGKGGRFVKRLEEIWDRLVKIYNAFVDMNRATDEFWRRMVLGAKRAADAVLGLASTVLGVFADIASAGAKLKIPGMKGISEDLRDMQRDLDKTREGLRKVDDQANKVDMSKVRRENRRTAEAFDDMAKRGKVSLRDIARTTDTRSKEIRDDLGGRSEEGKRALAGNFREAMGAVRRQMAAGKTSTKEGMQAIRGYLADELRVYGLNIAEGKRLVGEHPFADKLGASSPFAKKAAGGWIGSPGQAGMDTVPAMLAPGEAVLNRHQQAVIEGMLGGGFLDQLFARVQTPHYMARGGIVPVPGFPGESAASSVIPKILQIARQFGLTLTDAYGPGHKSLGHTRFGTDADFAGSDRSMDRAVRSLVRAGYLVGYDGRFGSQAWPGHGPSYVAGANAHLHVALGGKGGNIGATLATIKRRVVSGGGQVGRVVQGALDMSRAGAQSFLTNAANSAVSTPIGGGGSGGIGKAGLVRLWRAVNGRLGNANLMGAIGMAESGGRNVVNSIGAGGYWQIYPPEPNYLNPRTNAAIAGRKLRTQGLSAWEAYTNGSYRQYLARGGRAIRRFANGGRAGFETSQSQTTAAATGAEQRAAQGFALRSRRRTLAHRIGDYENYMGAVETVRKRYSLAERVYNRIDEGSLVNEETGEVNTEAVQRKADAIMQMMLLAGQIVHYLEEARKVAKRVVRSYKSIVSRLRSSLKHAKKKDRSGIRSQLADAVSGRDEYIGIVGDLGFDITNAKFDVEDLVKERNEILATTGRAADTTGTDTTTDTSPDVQAIADQATARATALAADLATVRANFAAFTSTGDLGSARGTSALGSALVDAAGGVGGANMAGIPGAFIDGGGGVTVIVQTQSLVPGSHAESLRVADAVTGVLGVRPVRPVTQATVG